MQFELKMPILGFDDVSKVKFEREEGGLATLTAVDGEKKFSFNLINPYLLLPGYDFELPAYLEALLNAANAEKMEVYVGLIYGGSLEKSSVNLLAPFVFNFDENTLAQVILNPQEYPFYGPAVPVKSLLEAAEKCEKN